MGGGEARGCFFQQAPPNAKGTPVGNDVARRFSFVCGEFIRSLVRFFSMFSVSDSGKSKNELTTSLPGWRRRG